MLSSLFEYAKDIARLDRLPGGQRVERINDAGVGRGLLLRIRNPWTVEHGRITVRIVMLTQDVILEGQNAITQWREMMGATNYKEAEEGTIRREFATDIEKNVVHGSDAPETAAFEIGYFFNAFEINAR